MKSILKYSDVLIWPILVLVLYALITVFGLFFLIPWLDTPIHFLGGASIALSTYFLLKHDAQFQPSRLIFFLLLLGTASYAAGMWELMEYFSDYYLGNIYFGEPMQGSLYDTMKDLLMGMCGGAVIAISKISKFRR